MGLKIDLLCNDGSPIGIVPADIEGRGVGGAEMAMISLMQKFGERGHSVRIYNDPKVAGKHGDVEYLPLRQYNNAEARDVLIVFRSPNIRFVHNRMSKNILKLWWSTDQYTIGSFKELADKVDFAVTISPYHTSYHHTKYGIPLEKMGHIDLGVRTEEYDQEVERIAGRCIFCSIPDRGLRVLHSAWPLIKRYAEDASLVITSDYTLWGATANNHNHRLMWTPHKDVQFLGNVPRSVLVKLQLQSELMTYPSTYEELFCVSAAEGQVSGAMPVTSITGALPTTNEFGLTLPGDPITTHYIERFAKRVSGLLTTERKYMVARRDAMMKAARLRFDWNVIAERWEYLFAHRNLGN